MVDLEQLEALDALLWMRSSRTAAKAILANQSTIVRRSKHALDIFGVSLHRGDGDWSLSGKTELLSLQRQVHQEARFQGLGRLRLHMPWWTSNLLHEELAEHLPRQWLCHPRQVRSRADDPISLLKDRVIDACLATPCQLTVTDPELFAFDVYRSGIQPMVVANAKPDFSLDVLDAGRFRLRLFDFLPKGCRNASKQLFDGYLEVADNDSSQSSDGHPLELAYLTPVMARAAGLPSRPHYSSLTPYVERLVVRHEHHEHPVIHQLLAGLSACFDQPRLVVADSA